MPSKLNSEFNYRTQVIGETVWAKIKTLKEFLEGRVSTAALREISVLRLKAKHSELAYLKKTSALEHIILTFEAELLEIASMQATQDAAFDLNDQEIVILKSLLKEYYELAEPTRIDGYTDDMMFEINAANEFTAMIGKEIYAEILACGSPSPAKLRNAMSNTHTWNALKIAGFIPPEALLLEANVDPLKIELKPMDKTLDCIKQPTILNLTMK